MKIKFEDVKNQLILKDITLVAERLNSKRYNFYTVNKYGFVKKKYNYLFQIVKEYKLQDVVKENCLPLDQ